MLPVEKQVKKKLKIKSPPKKYANFKIHIQKKESLENPFQSFKLLWKIEYIFTILYLIFKVFTS
jgi:hypothetical protein